MFLFGVSQIFLFCFANLRIPKHKNTYTQTHNGIILIKHKKKKKIDATFGDGGHSFEILMKNDNENHKIVAIDADKHVITCYLFFLFLFSFFCVCVYSTQEPTKQKQNKKIKKGY